MAGSAPNGNVMLTLTNGLLTFFNGLFAAVSSLASPVMIAIVLSAAGLAWMAVLECDELDRRGTKPGVRLH